jgi:hypothetical protein
MVITMVMLTYEQHAARARRELTRRRRPTLEDVHLHPADRRLRWLRLLYPGTAQLFPTAALLAAARGLTGPEAWRQARAIAIRHRLPTPRVTDPAARALLGQPPPLPRPPRPPAWLTLYAAAGPDPAAGAGVRSARQAAKNQAVLRHFGKDPFRFPHVTRVGHR